MSILNKLATGSTLAVAVAMLPTAAGGAAVPAPDARVGADFTWEGSWDSNWGLMTLTGDATGMEGTYTYDSGRIWADVVSGAGATYRGMWAEAPSYTGPSDAGYLEFRVSADGQSFEGDWNYTDSVGWTGTWRATCVAGACLGNSTDPLGPTIVVPETGRISGPSKLARPKVGTYRLTASHAGVSYQYRVDAGKWRSTKAAKVRIKSLSLKPGVHKLKVRAVLAGVADRTPSVKRIRVLR